MMMMIIITIVFDTLHCVGGIFGLLASFGLHSRFRGSNFTTHRLSCGLTWTTVCLISLWALFGGQTGFA